MRHADAVLLLSRVTGRNVLGPDGREVGRLTDLTVRVDGPRNTLGYIQSTIF